MKYSNCWKINISFFPEEVLLPVLFMTERKKEYISPNVSGIENIRLKIPNKCCSDIMAIDFLYLGMDSTKLTL